MGQPLIVLASWCIVVPFEGPVMMSTRVSGAVLLLTLVQAAPQRATVSPQTVVGTWVGTHSWAIDLSRQRSRY